MLEKMFGEDSYDDGGTAYVHEMLAKGQYESDPILILKGFKIFQKKYVYKSVVFQLVLVLLAIMSQVLALMSENSRSDPMFSSGLIMVCIVLGGWVVMRPRNTMKTLEKGIENLKGSIYETEICTDKIKISTIYDAPVENEKETEELTEEKKSDEQTDDEAEVEEEVIPATIIHLDNPTVEMIECEDMYILYVKKVNIFVIPKDAFTAEENTIVKEKLSEIMGIRYKGDE